MPTSDSVQVLLVGTISPRELDREPDEFLRASNSPCQGLRAHNGSVPRNRRESSGNPRYEWRLRSPQGDCSSQSARSACLPVGIHHHLLRIETPLHYLSHLRQFEPTRGTGVRGSAQHGVSEKVPLTCDVRVGRTGLEPVTPCVSCKCATRLRQRPLRATRVPPRIDPSALLG